MRTKILLSAWAAAAIIVFGCAKEKSASPLAGALVGTWEWTGDACDRAGKCDREIFTDESSRLTFSSGGTLKSSRGLVRYRLEGKRIDFATGRDRFDETLGEIVSIQNGVMLLREGKTIRRYGRTR